MYDGDGVTISDGNGDGVPDKPSASLLRARSTAAFDEQGRLERAQTFSVSQADGSVSSNALTTDIWYGRRGQVLKTASPGGLVSKAEYDGAGRVTKSYGSDGGGDSAWSDAANVTGDAVLEQVETQYDADSNPIFVTARQRFHDETATGVLGEPTTAPKARVSYAASYYDLGDRLTATVDVGTNAGTAYTRPGSVPARSDTVLVNSFTYNTAGWLDTATDPRGIVAKSFYDNLGQVTKTIAAYTDGTPTNNTNKTTEFTYDGSGHVLTVKALLTSGAYEQTQYVYGVTTGGGSGVNSNDLVAELRYPDKSSGNVSSTEKEIYSYNALGQPKTAQDRNGNVHAYSFDVLGRPTADAVTTLGTGIDGAVRRLETAYDTQGNPYLFTSYDAASAGNVVNQVQRDFNGLGQLTKEYQAHSGTVNTGTTPKVQYAYSEMSGGANHSRLTSMTYPNGKVLNYNYTAALDAAISRLTSLSDSTTLESFDYLGLGTVVRRAHPQNGIDLTYIKQSGESNGDAGDQYTGLDRFGRVVDQRWIKTSDGSHTDRFKYGYDRDGNRLYRENVVNALFSELYHANGASSGYDNLNQLQEFRRGTLSDTNSDNVPDTVTTASRSQSWTFDAQGNWSSLNTDGTSVSRTHNKQNQVTAVGAATLTFDNNGNLTTDESGKQLVFDAWNRLVQVKDSGGATLAAYKYDALGRRIVETVGGTTKDIYFSAAWQVLEEQVSSTTKAQYVWSPVYVDALVLRDRDADGNTGNGLEERLYVQQDANFNVSAVVSTSGTVVERDVYDAYGKPTFLTAAWGTLSGSAVAWVYLHQGGRYETSTGLYQFGYRDLSATLGRWVEQDPIGFSGRDTNLYRDVGNNVTNAADPSGLETFVPDPPLTVGPQRGSSHFYVYRTGLGAIRVSTQRYVGLLRPDGYVERNGRIASRGAVETAGYQEDWNAWFEQNGHAERGEAMGPLAPVRGDVGSGLQGIAAQGRNFEAETQQAAALTRNLGITVVITAASAYVCARFSASNTAPARAAAPQAVRNTVRQFQARRFQIGNHIFQLDRSAMTHILERHHPSFWDGSVRTVQSFFDARMTTEDLVTVVADVMRQNREFILQRGNNAIYTLPATTVGEVQYILGVNNGRIAQLYPVVPVP
jgi:RHS repeat-associated protein